MAHTLALLFFPSIHPSTCPDQCHVACAGATGGDRPRGDRPRDGGFGRDREGYRSGPREGGGFGRGGDKAGAPGDYQPAFGGGFGRGGAPQ